jgi:hypothetical protein
MQAQSFKYFLLFAVLMFTAKPFVGFCMCNHIHTTESETRILVKAFTKRKQEYVDGSEFDITTLQNRIANPLLALHLLFSFFLNYLFPLVFSSLKPATNRILCAINADLLPPLPRYLLSGKLII